MNIKHKNNALLRKKCIEDSVFFTDQNVCYCFDEFIFTSFKSVSFLAVIYFFLNFSRHRNYFCNVKNRLKIVSRKRPRYNLLSSLLCCVPA